MAKCDLNQHSTGWRAGAFTAYTADHCPVNKRRWEIHKSSIVLSVKDYNGRKPGANPDAWTQIDLEETTQAKEGGNFQTRQLSLTLDAEGRAALRAYLDASEADTHGVEPPAPMRSVKLYSREGAADPFVYVGSVGTMPGDVDYEGHATRGFDLRNCEVMALTESGHAYTFHV